MRFSFYGHMVCFVNCHLAAHMNNALQRVDEFEYILETQDFDIYDTPHVLDHKSVHLHRGTQTLNVCVCVCTLRVVVQVQWGSVTLSQGGVLVWWSELPHRRPRFALPPLIHQQWTAKFAMEQRPGIALDWACTHTHSQWHTLINYFYILAAHHDEEEGSVPAGVWGGAIKF